MTILSDPLRRGIGTMLWLGSLGERRAIGVFHRLRHGTLLTEAEREPLARFMDEEIDHGNLLRACAKRYVSARLDFPRPLFPAHLTPEPRLVAALHAAERYAQPGFELQRALFHRLGDTESVATFERLIAEEPGHIAWGRGVLERLRREYPELAADFTATRRPLIRAYKAARRDRWFLREASGV